MRLLAVALLIVSCLGSEANAEELRKATVLVRGAHCKECVSAIRKQLASVKGVKLDVGAISVGKKRRFFSEPFVVEVGKTLDTGIGALAKATAEAKTPHGDDIPPRLNLVLFTDQRIDEPSVMALRAALRQVNGVLVVENGGLGGMPDRGLYWIRLEPVGGAELQDVFNAAKSAVDVSLLDDE